jgi:organic hydroperoxide reductase OsmC/OhrA
MSTMIVALRNIAGTEAALGWANGHTLVVDRAEGRAGGQGLGFNGGELLALTIGGCFANDLRYTAHAMGLSIGAIALTVAVDIDGDPLLCRSARLQVSVELAGGADPTELVERTEAISMAANSLRRGFPVEVVRAA